MWSAASCLYFFVDGGAALNGAPLPHVGHLSGFLASLLTFLVAALDGDAFLNFSFCLPLTFFLQSLFFLACRRRRAAAARLARSRAAAAFLAAAALCPP